MAAVRVDWRLAEFQYVTGGPEVTCGTLAAEHKVTEQCVREHCAKGKWTEKRQRYGDTVATAALQKSEEDAVAVLAAQNAHIAGSTYGVASGLFDMLSEAVEAAKASYGAGALVADARGLQALGTLAAIAVDKWRGSTGQAERKQKLELGADPEAPIALKFVVVDKRTGDGDNGNGGNGNGGSSAEHTGA